MSFEDWKHTEEYKRLIQTFGDFGYVEAIAETAYRAAQANTEMRERIAE